MQAESDELRSLPLLPAEYCKYASNVDLPLIRLISSSVISACIAQIIYTARGVGKGDPTFDLWPATICAQVTQSISLTTACIPYLQPFLLSLESGFLWGDDFRRQSTKNSSYTSGRPSKSASTGQPRSSHTSRNQSIPKNTQKRDQDGETGRPDSPAIAMLPVPNGGEPLPTQMDMSWDSRSASSQARLTGIMTPAHVGVDTRRRELEGY